MNESEELEKLKERVGRLEAKFNVFFKVLLYLLRELEPEAVSNLLDKAAYELASMTEEEKQEFVAWHRRVFGDL
jgi:hypothetical protein